MECVDVVVGHVTAVGLLPALRHPGRVPIALIWSRFGSPMGTRPGPTASDPGRPESADETLTGARLPKSTTVPARDQE